MPAPRLFRFRLRTLLVLVTLASLVLGWYTVSARQTAAEVAVLERLREATNGAMVVIRDGEGVEWGALAEDPTQAVSVTKRWIGPSWTRPLLTRLRLPILYRVTDLTFYMPFSLSEDDLRALGVFHHVQNIEVIDLGGAIFPQPVAIPNPIQRLRELFPQAKVVISP